MPRTPPERPAATEPGNALDPVAQVNAVLASAAQLTGKNMVRPKHLGAGGDWQNEAWYFYDTVGEFHFGVNWKAQAASQCELYIEEETADGPVRVLEGPEVDALEMVFGGDAGHSQALATATLHMEVPGEFYLIGELLDELDRPDPQGSEQWRIYSNEECKPKPNTDPAQFELDRGDGKKRTITEDSAAVFRIWSPHPRRYVEADSPARAALPILREIEQLTKHVAAQIDSRLAGAGILFVPTEMTFSGVATATTGQVATEGEADPAPEPVAQEAVNKFLTDLIEAMLAPIANRDHPSAVVPVVVKAPGALIDKVKHLTFDTPLDKKSLELRKEGVGRLAITADMPADILLGIGDVNHWSAWQLEESAIKVHVEPGLETITSGLTSAWLPWAVKALGGIVNPLRRIKADTQNLRLRPDRSQQAQWLYDHLELGGEALRRETGFEEGDAPTADELRDLILRRIAAQGGATPELIVAAVQVLMAGGNTLPPIKLVPTEAAPPAIEQGGEPAAEEPTGGENQPPADTGPETQAEPPPAAAASAAEVAVYAAAELLCKRAVERANNRANRRGKTRKPIPADQLDAALQGAWDELPRTAELLGVEAGWLQERCEAYTRAVLTKGVAHAPAVLQRTLDAEQVKAPS